MKVTLQRVLAEKRAWIAPLGLVFLLNAGIFALAVYPLSTRVGAAQTRAERAAVELAAAEQDNAGAEAARIAHDRANAALGAFYTDVLPPDLAGANRITYLRLAQLARELNLRAERRSYEPEDPARDGVLGRLKISMALRGDYADVRAFIYELETADEFVVIEDLALSEGTDQESTLELALTLATYYRTTTDGR
jgi:hypothetical protein